MFVNPQRSTHLSKLMLRRLEEWLLQTEKPPAFLSMAAPRPPAAAVLLTVFTVFFGCTLALVAAASEAPPFFIFGDSVVDCGNNDYLFNSTATADYLPYGIDFYEISGRFTNARTIADVLGQLLGHETFIPCANNPNTTGEKVLNGVNFASAGTGILPNSTGGMINTPLPYQIEHFAEKVLPELESQLGSNLSSYLDEAIFMFNTGGNDYIFDCFDTGESCNLTEFTDYLVGYYGQLLQTMYGYGVRKFLLFSTEVSGCTPVARKRNGGLCNENYNNASKKFNSKLNSSVDIFMQDLPGSQFVFVNVYGLLDELLKNGTTYGFTVTNASCCPMAYEKSTCVENGPVCADRNSYVYFDGGHPTDAANVVLANEIFSSNRTMVAYPYNVMTFAGISPAAAGQYSVLPSRLTAVGIDVQ